MKGAARLAPATFAGLLGMLLVAGLYVAHALLLRSGGSGLGAAWLLALLLPGAVAAYLCERRGTRHASREGALAGIVTAHFASALQVAVLALGVLTTDWARYAQQVGPQVAAGARDAALAATLVAAAVTIAATYVACALAGWLGSVAYQLVRKRGT
jgi:hypothetical protein